MPALITHEHVVVCYVRSPEKLRSLIPSNLLQKVIMCEGDALDSEALTRALLENDCEGIINTAHNKTARRGSTNDPVHLSRPAAEAAVNAGRTRVKPLRAWFIGGLGSLEYPGTGGWRIEDYMPLFMTAHHRETEKILKAILPSELEWTLLCVAMMYPRDQDIAHKLVEPARHNLAVVANAPPSWQDHWIRSIPVIGVDLNLIPVVRSYSTRLEDVANMLAEHLEEPRRRAFVGQLVGMKEMKFKGA